MEQPQKPTLPKGCGSWWNTRVADLPPDLAELKRNYYKQYNAWKRAQRSGAPQKTRKMPEGVSRWWNKPVAELTPEQLEFKRKYERENRREYQREFKRAVKKRAEEEIRNLYKQIDELEARIQTFKN